MFPNAKAPNAETHNKKVHKTKALSPGLQATALAKQQGVLIPLAIFVVAGMALLAVAIARLSAQSSGSSFREAVSAQTFYAAESAAQYAVNQITFPAADRTLGDSQCGAINGSTLDLLNCSADLTCAVSTNTDNTTSFYTVQASATCGSGELQATRIIQTSVYLP